MTDKTSVLKILGEVHGVELRTRGPNDNHIVIQLLGEDDDNWFTVGNGFSSFWLGDLMHVLQDVERLLNTDHRFEPDPSGFGKQLKSG